MLSRHPGARTGLLTTAALVGFAANSILCRFALGSHSIDAAGFTAVRVLSGAAMLGLIVTLRRPLPGWPRSNGSWSGALALLVYAVAFSYAYLGMGAATGALILFGAVQLTMIGWGLWRGERPGAWEWLGTLLALLGFLLLTLPHADAPPLWAGALMALAGIAWGSYSLLGRGVGSPLLGTASNFLRGTPVVLLLLLAVHRQLDFSPRGVLLAMASGALASGLGYSLWYAAVPSLSATRAAVVQLSVPVLVAVAGVLLLDERVGTRLVVAAAAILGGVAISVLSRRRV